MPEMKRKREEVEVDFDVDDEDVDGNDDVDDDEEKETSSSGNEFKLEDSSVSDDEDEEEEDPRPSPPPRRTSSSSSSSRAKKTPPKKKKTKIEDETRRIKGERKVQSWTKEEDAVFMKAVIDFVSVLKLDYASIVPGLKKLNNGSERTKNSVSLHWAQTLKPKVLKALEEIDGRR